MSYKSETVSGGIFFLIIAGLIFYGLPTIYEYGKERSRTEILKECQDHQVVTIDGIEIHCGIIGPNVNLKAAEYRAVKNCVKLIEGWINE